jgi:hypothetical protein
MQRESSSLVARIEGNKRQLQEGWLVDGGIPIILAFSYVRIGWRDKIIICVIGGSGRITKIIPTVIRKMLLWFGHYCLRGGSTKPFLL